MPESIGRRRFLKTSAASAAGAWLGGFRVAELAAAVPAPPAGPFRVSAQSADPATPLAYRTITEVSAAIGRGELTPVDLVEACLDRIATAEPVVRAWVDLYGDDALEAAHHATADIARDGQRTPLHGIPFGIKDLYDIEGKRTRCGSAVRADVAPAVRDAAVVARLRSAGALLLGKTNTHEFAFGVWSPPTSNPWDTSRIPGGSSGGSAAALAAGMTFGATGTDTGASIRLPAALCNVVGFKPTFGTVSRAGVFPLSWSLDHAGPLARSVEDCALIADALAGRDVADPSTSEAGETNFTRALGAPITGLRIGVPTSVFFDGCDPEVRAVVEAAAVTLASLGATVVPVDPPATQRIASTAYLALQLSEPLAIHETYLRARSHEYQTQTQVLLALGTKWSAGDYLRAQRIRTLNIREWLHVFSSIDAVLTPTAPRPAPIKEEAQATGVFELVNYTSPFNFSGFPSISVPAGFTAGGLPVGAMLTARPFDDARLMQIAFALQEAIGAHRAMPPQDAQAR
ncbi:MAG TPA: amidase [Actinomycetota bacterium]|nr:amidase [Actinomycetota bacterium]